MIRFSSSEISLTALFSCVLSELKMEPEKKIWLVKKYIKQISKIYTYLTSIPHNVIFGVHPALFG